MYEASGSLHQIACIDLENLISPHRARRVESARNRRRSEWERLNLMPLPKESLSDRLILDDRDEVRPAIERRDGARRGASFPFAAKSEARADAQTTRRLHLADEG
jgi:hypothetical protein